MGETVTEDGNLKWKCICDAEYATYPNPKPDDVDEMYCNYKRKVQKTAFFLDFFFGMFGAGHWYIGSYVMAGIKLGLCVGVCYCGSCFCVVVADEMDEEAPAVCWGVCSTLAVFIWWLVDVIRFGKNFYDDDNGIGLEPW